MEALHRLIRTEQHPDSGIDETTKKIIVDSFHYRDNIKTTIELFGI